MAPHSSTLPGKSHGWRSLVGCSPWGPWASDTTEQFPFYFSLSCIGEGNGNPLQCSCLENPMPKETCLSLKRRRAEQKDGKNLETDVRGKKMIVYCVSGALHLFSKYLLSALCRKRCYSYKCSEYSRPSPCSLCIVLWGVNPHTNR